MLKMPRFVFIILLPAALSVSADISLLNRNPFIWPGFEARTQDTPPAAAQTSAEDYEFHAVYELSGSTHILLRDRKKNDFQWLSIGEEEGGLNPKSYNPESNQLLLAYENKELWLSLKETPQASPTPVATAPRSTARPTVANTRSAERRVIRNPAARRRALASNSDVRRRVIRPPSSSGSAGSTAGNSRGTAQDIGLTQPNYVPQAPVSNRPPTSAPDFIPSLINPPPIPNP